MKNKSYLWLYYISSGLTLLVMGYSSIKFTPSLYFYDNYSFFNRFLDAKLIIFKY